MRENENFREMMADIKLEFGDIKMLDVAQTAKMLNCDRRTVKLLIEKKKLPAVDISTGVNKIYRIPATSLARFITKKEK